jgi:hypothetical protein
MSTFNESSVPILLGLARLFFILGFGTPDSLVTSCFVSSCVKPLLQNCQQSFAGFLGVRLDRPSNLYVPLASCPSNKEIFKHI